MPETINDKKNSLAEQIAVIEEQYKSAIQSGETFAQVKKIFILLKKIYAEAGIEMYSLFRNERLISSL